MDRFRGGVTVTFSDPPGVSDAPNFVMTRYGVFELTNGERHFFGFHAGGNRGRISSPIVAFAKASMIGTTMSGRTYRLQGLPGGAEVLVLAQIWCATHGVDIRCDVTEEFLGGVAC